MKNQSITLLHFSGYPLGIVEKTNQKEKVEKHSLSVIKPEQKIKNNDMANNPGNWDVSWFCNYE